MDTKANCKEALVLSCGGGVYKMLSLFYLIIKSYIFSEK